MKCQAFSLNSGDKRTMLRFLKALEKLNKCSINVKTFMKIYDAAKFLHISVYKVLIKYEMYRKSTVSYNMI